MEGHHAFCQRMKARLPVFVVLQLSFFNATPFAASHVQIFQ
jgi:hypothetical protein